MAGHLRNICTQEGISAEEDALNIIAQKADGALRDALSIYDRIVSFSGNNIKYQDVIENLNILDYDYYFKVVDAIVSEDVSELMLIFDSIQRKGFDGEIFINGLAEHLRNLLVCQRPETASLLEVSGNIKERYLQQAALVPTSIIVSALSLASDCDINYKMSRNKRLHVEMTLIKMAFIRQALQQVAFPSSGEGNEKKNSPKLSTAADNSYSYSIEQKVAQKTVSIKPELADPEEDYSEKGEAVADNHPPIEKESLLSKLKNKKGGLLTSLISEVEEDEQSYQKVEARGGSYTRWYQDS
jgi:DNA polymerase-3 subunit gamma/tau